MVRGLRFLVHSHVAVKVCPIWFTTLPKDGITCTDIFSSTSAHLVYCNVQWLFILVYVPITRNLDLFTYIFSICCSTSLTCSSNQPLEWSKVCWTRIMHIEWGCSYLPWHKWIFSFGNYNHSASRCTHLHLYNSYKNYCSSNCLMEIFFIMTVQHND